MAIPNNPLVCRVNLVFRADTRHFINSFHVSDPAGWDLAKMQVISNAFKSWWANDYRDNVSNQVNLEQVQVRLYDPSNPLALDDTVGLPLAGLRASIHEPYNVTVTMSWRTGLAGRKYRGRTYVPGLTEDQTNTDDTINSTVVSELAAAAQALLLAIASTTADFIIWHASTNTFTKVITFVIDFILDSQRRRLPGRGR